ncbi:lipoate--protein ligase family protein [Bifidobacterium sp. SO4]|uniref:lipoate--protein ligase family protein n=1 Tax=Bifidobacterium sp. SO4 TaxID=2809030 RepID=UPI001BDC56A9|nr:lipoate--protein ligase family protein [Bifidobacterium sp. SO4]MBT1169983.1 lipoate--protein ligase family protein [Bifidobacterium sp. SO4]
MTTKRGECKTPGGKLAAVTVTLAGDGTVESCRLDGDFFVESPSDAASRALLHDIEEALKSGKPVQAALEAHPEARLVGTDAAAIETAYARAMGEGKAGPVLRQSDGPGIAARSAAPLNANAPCRPSPDGTSRFVGDDAGYQARWESLKRDLAVIHDVPRMPAEQMAIDETWAREVAAGKRQPTLRIWEWAGPAVVIGKFQSAPDEVNLDVAERLGFDVVRRCTGGGAMFIEPGNTITYSLYAPLDFVAGVSIEESYRLCDWWLVESLRGLGLDVRFAGLNDIASQYGKIGGAAQRRFPDGTHAGPGSVLHHVTMAYDIDAETMGQVLNTSREKLSDKAVKSAVKRVDPVKSQTGLSREAIIDHLLAWFGERMDTVNR